MRTTFIVIIGHLIIVSFLAYFHPPLSKTPTRASVKVQTITLREKKENSLAESIPPIQTLTPNPEPQTQSKPEEPKPQIQSKPEEPKLQTQSKPEKPKPITKPTQKASPKPATKTQQKATVTKEADPNRKKLLSMMEESLKNLDASKTSTASSTSPTVSTPKLSKLASESITFSTNYQAELIAYFEQLLTLPEKGEVKIKLILLRNGKVQDLSILNASSERNRSYVLESLPHLSLPPFDKHFKGESSHTFNITLTSRS